MNPKAEATTVVDRATSVLDRLNHPGICAVFLYGSVNEHRQREDSDIDIAVLDPAEPRLSWADQAVLASELERAVGRPVDLRMLRDCPLTLQAHVIQRGLLFWEPDRRVLEAYRASVLQQYERERLERERRWNRTLRSFAERESTPHEPRLPR